MGINHKLESLNKFHQSVILSRLIEDIDRDHHSSDQNLGATVIFSKGPDGVPRKKKEPAMLGKVTSVHESTISRPC